mmetsp:Transcript_59796/g.142352  ORF Transcript_59796/g.142352 Transcript_59796/m.142352 type:complete len:1034 (+) Transcript_59796:90-3191(+)
MSSTRLKYSIAKCSSEDPEYQVSELLVHSSQTRGWQTARFCDYPQEVGLEFENPVHLRQIQFLSHPSKIATKIELYAALPPAGQTCSYDTATFKRLGYLSLDSNERSQFQARELKSVYVDVSVQFLRIMLHKCHVNRYNIVNQVGLHALYCLGEGLGPDLKVGPPAPNPMLDRGQQPPQQPQHHRPQQQLSAPPSQPQPCPAEPSQAAPIGTDEVEDAKYDQRTLERIRSLEKAKQRAVEAEDYEEAKRCKEMLGRLRQTGVVLRDLEEKKRQAVANEDYDAAKSLKAEIDRLRTALEKPQGAPPAAPGKPAAFTGACQQEGRVSPEWPPPAPAPAAAAPAMAPRGGHQPVMAQAPMTPMTSGEDPAGLFGRAPSQGRRSDNQQQSQPMSAGGNSVGSRAPASQGSREPRAHSAHEAAGSRPRSGRTPPLPTHAGQDHPLHGVPNAEELGEPEPLDPNDKDADLLIANFGEYLARCLHSKTWNLRDAALQKLSLDLHQGYGADRQQLQAYAAALQRTIPDRSVQVFMSSCNLLHAVCGQFLSSPAVRSAEATAAVDPLVPQLLERVGDANARVEKTTREALQELAKCNSLGANWVAQHLLRPLRKKSVHARVYSSRLQLLAALALEHGVQPRSRDGIPQDETLQLAMEWFSNPAADVRENAVKLVAACHVHLGIDPLEPYLAKLRPAQREVFEVEFQRAAAENGGFGAPVANTPPQAAPAAFPGGSGRSRESKTPPGGASRGMEFQPSPRGMSWDPPVDPSATMMSSSSGYPAQANGFSHPCASRSAAPPPAAAGPGNLPRSPLGNSVGGAGQMAVGGMTNDDEYGDPGRLVECSGCGRRFNEEAMARHAKVCKKVFQQKRKQFNSAANRLGDLENAGALIANAQKINEDKERTAAQQTADAVQPSKGSKPAKEDPKNMPQWKKDSLAFRAAILRAKAASGDTQAQVEAQVMEQKLEAAGGADSNLTKCPHCGRTFNKEAAERHIPICLKTFGSKAGGGRLPKGGGQGAHAGKPQGSAAPASIRGPSAQRSRA